jgi:phage anti-repressor protein
MEFSYRCSGNWRFAVCKLSMDVAKEICMVENNEIGKTFRRYFIECEKELRAGSTIDPNLIAL